MPDDQATADALRDRVDELERRVAELQNSGDVGRRRVLAALAGAAGLGAAGVHLGAAPAAAQAAGQVGTASDPVDVFGYNVQAENGVETPSLTDTDTGTTYDIGTFTEGEVLSDQDGDGVYTLPSGSVGIDVPEVSTDALEAGTAITTSQTVVRAVNNSSSTLSVNTWETLKFDLEREDVNSEWDDTNNQFTPLESGIYEILCFAPISPGSSGDDIMFRLRDVTNGATISDNIATFAFSGTSEYTYPALFRESLTAGETYELQARASDSSASQLGNRGGPLIIKKVIV